MQVEDPLMQLVIWNTAVRLWRERSTESAQLSALYVCVDILRCMGFESPSFVSIGG